MAQPKRLMRVVFERAATEDEKAARGHRPHDTVRIQWDEPAELEILDGVPTLIFRGQTYTQPEFKAAFPGASIGGR